MRLPFLGWRARREAELEEEIRAHLRMAVRERVARGEDPRSAEEAARREFGNVVHVKEVTREQWRSAVLERSARELTQALRALRRTPGFTAGCVLVLALGIGMSTAIFAVYDAVLVQALPVRAPERLVLPRTLDPGGADVGMTQQELKELAVSSGTMRALAGVAHQGAFTTSLTDGDRVLALKASWVTGNFFDVLGVRPELGRLFNAGDEATAGAMSTPIVLSYDTWKRRFGGDPGVIGRLVGNPYTHEHARIIGVAPPGLAYPAGTEYWTPLVYSILDVVARLEPGATLVSARAEFFSVMRRIDAERVASGRQGAGLARAEIETFRHAVVGDVRPQLVAVVAAVALLLLIACANVGGLVLLRATSREVEVAVRRSLGAGVGDIVRPLLWESAILALCGGLLGFACAEGVLRVLPRLAPPALPRLNVVRLSAAPLGIAAGVTVAALVLAAVVPTLATLRSTPASPLRLDSRSGRTGRARRRLRQALVASQVAIALVMLTGAGLLVRSLDRLTRVPLGYRPEHLSILTIAKPIPPDSAMSEFIALYDRVAPRIVAIPGVVSMTPVTADPFYGAHVFTGRWTAEGESDATARANPLVPFEVGGPDYFRTFDIPLLRGRGFLETDVAGAPPVVIVSRAVAERFWPGEDPVGKQVRFVGDTSADAWHTVVGEAADIRFRSVREATPTMYMPWRQTFFQGVVALRTKGPLATVLPALRRAVQGADPEATIARARTMDGLLDEQLALPRVSTLILSAFGGAALLLAGIGLYGTMASAVRERTHELGIRAALGATPARLLGGVLAQAAAIAGAGAAIGVAGAVAATRFLRALLFEVRPTDPAALLGACALLLAVAILAAYVPAWRATRADPSRALRAE